MTRDDRESVGRLRRGARTLGRQLPAQGGDQVEQYLLDYATQLMPHRTTWPVRRLGCVTVQRLSHFPEPPHVWRSRSSACCASMR